MAVLRVFGWVGSLAAMLAMSGCNPPSNSSSAAPVSTAQPVIALFTDFGTLGLLDKKDTINPDTNQPLATVQDDLNLRASAGISIFWKSPMGPLRFDFSQIIKKDHYDVTELFRFSTSTRF